MITDDTQMVSALQASLARRVGKERFELWFGANTRLALVDGSLEVSVPSQFYQDWLRSHFRPHLEAACLETLGKSLDVTFHVDAQLAQVSPVVATAKPVPPPSSGILAGNDAPSRTARANSCVTMPIANAGSAARAMSSRVK